MNAVRSTKRRVSEGGAAASSACSTDGGCGGGGGGCGADDAGKPQKTKPSSNPTTAELRGVPVHFPFRPYDCQRKYMECVLDALHRSENALLESPTGTGKTLSLLCAALAWQREQARRLPRNGGGGGVGGGVGVDGDDDAGVVKLEGGDGGDGAVAGVAARATSLDSIHPDSGAGGGGGGTSQGGGVARVPTIVYASRTHSQLSQVVHELRNTRYRPRHAVLASREQMCVHEKVSALAGNTLINNECARLSKDRKCRYRNNLDHFGGPAPDASGGGAQPVLDVEDLVAMGKKHKVCPFYHTRETTKDADLVLLPYNYLFDRESRASIDVRWGGAVVIFDEAHNLESFASEAASFELSGLDLGGCLREVSRGIDLLGRLGVDQGDGGSVKVENLVKLKAMFLRLEEFLDRGAPAGGKCFSGEYIFEFFRYASLTYQNHEIFVTFVNQTSERIMEATGAKVASSGTPRLQHFVGCVKRAFAGSSEAQCIAKSRAYRVHVSATGGGGGGGGGGSRGGPRTLSYWCFAPSLAMRELADLGLRSIIVTSGTLSPISSYSLELGIPFPITLENPHIIRPNQVHVRVMGKGVSNKNLKSSYDRRDDPEYISELGNTLVSLAKIIPGGMLVFFPSYGVMDKCIDGWGGPGRRTTWLSDSGGNKKSKFFAAKKRSQSGDGSKRFSFPYTSTYFTSQNPTTPWKRLLSQKSIVIEPKSSAEMKEAIAEFDRYIDGSNGKGCLLMGVCRGKISEGIDFADKRARAVIITGLPFAPFQDPKVKLKREFLDAAKASSSARPSDDGGFGAERVVSTSTNGNGGGTGETSISGSEWYSQQAHRAVNQAVGRVIRHRFDYGAVLLLDSRFGDPRNQCGMSKWVRPYIQRDEGFGKAISTLVRFYREASSDPLLSKTSASKQGLVPRRNNATRLEYEDEEKTIQNKNEVPGEADMMDNIAVIQATRGPSRDCDGKGIIAESSCGSYVPPERVIKRIVLKGTTGQTEMTSKRTEHDDGTKIRDSIKFGLADLYAAKDTAKPAGDEKLGSATNAPSAWEGLTVGKSLVPQAHKRIPYIKSNKIGGSGALSTSTMSLSGEGGSQAPSTTQARSQLSCTNVGRKVGKERKESSTSQAAQQFFCASQANMSEDDFQVLRSLLVRLKEEGDSADCRSYLRVAKELVELLIKYDGVGLVRLFFPLLPLKHRSSVHAVVNEVRNTVHLSRLKKAEAKLCGEGSLNVTLFRKPQIKFEPKVCHEPSSKEAEDTRQEKAAALLHASHIHQMARQRITAQAHKRQANAPRSHAIPLAIKHLRPTDPSQRITGDDKAVSKTCVTSKRARAILNATSKRSDIDCPVSPQNRRDVKVVSTQDLDPIDRCLRQAGSDSITQGSPPRRVDSTRPRVKANVPKGLVCTICETHPEQPMLADCGHSACLNCWVKWLSRKGTCPVCRKPTSKTGLARMIFEKEAGSGVPTLSQICDTEGDSYMSDD